LEHCNFITLSLSFDLGIIFYYTNIITEFLKNGIVFDKFCIHCHIFFILDNFFDFYLFFDKMDIMLKTRTKTKIIKDFQIHKKDTGSTEVQIAVLTRRIDDLSKHLKKHRQDKHSRRGLLQMVSQRRNLLDYLKRKENKKYINIIKKLNLKK
jgi:small subunit ribosomal protein S15